MRKIYQRRLPSDLSKDYYFIHRETGRTEPVLIEYGFIDSPKDDVKQLQNDLLEYAEAVVEAVAEYAGVPYSKPSSQIPNTYTVKKNDNLWTIAQTYNTTINDLVKLNNLSTTVLQIGQVLKIPTSTNVQTTPQPTLPTGNTYVVQRGDSLWSIAKKYNITVNELKNYNNLTTNLLTIGQILNIPTENANPTTYTVQKGDSLWAISRKFDITVQDLIDANNLQTNTLQIGQILKIPN